MPRTVRRAGISFEDRSWFAFTASLRTIGLAAGSAAGAGALTVSGNGSLRWMIAVDAATHLLAAACLAAFTPSSSPSAPRGRWACPPRRRACCSSSTP
ncbi:hypothetical protein ACFXG6_00425 [Streptomyces roseus]|uniref:hypothetical protein n=1 Tax=Streptomyces roseus TaxID=66430 RepID=UPI003689BFED